MASLTFGNRFVATDLLGHGGMGLVYSGVDKTTGERVAIKTIAHSDTDLLITLEREIRALKRLRHPGVVRLVDSGLQDALPWYAMELVSGRDVRSSLGAPTALENQKTEVGLDISEGAATSIDAVPVAEGPSTLAPLAPREWVTRFVRLVAETLAYLHGEGLVHRDLKPENIILSGDDLPILIDFGIVWNSHGEGVRDALNSGGIGAGTRAYMAPEVLEVKAVDARADIYSLGCIFCELLTGAPPNAHGHPLPAGVSLDLPPSLANLLKRMLQPDPEQRIAYAADVVSELARLGVKDTWPQSPKHRSYLYRARFRGRHQALEQIKSSFDGMTAGKGSFIVFTGEEGSGKTRLLAEASRFGEDARIDVYTGHGTELEARRPLGLFSEVLHAVYAFASGKTHADALAAAREAAPLLAVYAPIFKRLLPAGAEPDANVLDARQIIFSRLGDLMATMAQKRPFALLLDDLQWTDGLSLDFLQWIANERICNWLTLCATTRLEGIDAQVKKLVNHPGVKHQSMGPLSADDISAIAADMLVLHPLPQELHSFFAQNCSSSPLGIAEYLSLAVQQGLLTRSADGGWQPSHYLPDETASSSSSSSADIVEMFTHLPIPGSLERLAEWRLSALNDNEQRIAEIAAVVGSEFTEALLREISLRALGIVVLGDDIDELVSKQIVAYDRSDLLKFSNARVHDRLYRSLAPDRRQAIHRTCAEYLEEQRRTADAGAAILAGHWEHAGFHDKAMAYHLDAAHGDVSSYAYASAANHYRAYLRLDKQPSARRAAAYNDLAECVFLGNADTKEALELHRRAMDDAVAHNVLAEQARAYRHMGGILMRTGELNEALLASQKANALAKTTGDAFTEAESLRHISYIYMSQGNLTEALRYAEQGLLLYEQGAFTSGSVSMMGQVAIMHWWNCNFQRAEAILQRAFEIASQSGDIAGQASILTRFILLYWKIGDFDKGREYGGRCAALAKKYRMRRVMGLTDGFMAGIYSGQQEFEVAVKAGRRAAEVLKVGNEVLSQFALYFLCEALVAQGLVDEPLGAYHAVIDKRESSRDERFLALVFYGLARLERRLGMPAEQVLGHLQQAHLHFEHYGDRCGRAWCIVERGHLELRGERPAEKAIAEATQVLGELGVLPSSHTAQVVKGLQLAQAALNAGQRLIEGEAQASLPEALYAAMRQRL